MIRFLLFISCTVSCLLITHPGARGQALANRCGTDIYLLSAYAKNRGYREAIQKANLILNQEMQKRLSGKSIQPDQAESIKPVINIPIVFHIVLPDAGTVTDAEVNYQLDVLNRDFAGTNEDSTNLLPMFPYSLRAHTNIRFCLAQKDTRGNSTTGIERRCSSTLSTTLADDPVKLSAKGGLDVWDPLEYYNVWVCNSSLEGLLGYATFPFSFSGYAAPDPPFQGVVISRGGFGSIRSPYSFNRGRTLVHETGHYFGLFHNFEGGCNSTDFSLSSVGGTQVDDTPAQSNYTGAGSPSTAGCPSGLVASGCSAVADAGRLYQNFMDYTDDPCMSMFTVNQALRMEAAIDLFRPSLKRTGACVQPLLLINNIAAWQVINPTGTRLGGFAGCSPEGNSIFYCTSAGSFTFTPEIKLRNTGSNLVQEVDIWHSVDNLPAQFNTRAGFTAGLPYLADTTITLQPIICNGGAHVLRFFTKSPNGVPDTKPDNDTITTQVFVDVPSAGPVQGFEQQAFPPAGWETFNSDGTNVSWSWSDSARMSGVTAAFLNLYDYTKKGSYKNLVTPNIDVRDADSIVVGFERAYRVRSLVTSNVMDTLELVISTDCKKTYTPVWKKGGINLATTPRPTGAVSWFAAKTDWLEESIDIKPFVSREITSLHVGFRARSSGNGQNLFLDDISIRVIKRPRRDAAIVRILRPAENVCSGTLKPNLLISNAGKDTLRSVRLNYDIDGGSTGVLNWAGGLAEGQTVTILLPDINVSAVGAHRFNVYTSEPNQSADQNTLNDTARIRFMVFSAVPAPVNESFETALFPPATWNLTGFNTLQWQKTQLGSTQGTGSAWLPNYRFNAHGAKSDLYSPVIRVTNADSVFVRFDLAYNSLVFPGNAGAVTDTLEVLFTDDCGQSLRSIYKKWGNELQTVTQSYTYSVRDTAGFVPTLRSQWRMDSINLTGIAGPTAQFQLVFRNISNHGNNLFLDNIRFNQVILPARLKSQGYLILPNPSTGVFYLRHYLLPVNLKAVQVVNASGQLIWMKSYTSDASSLIILDLSGQAAGVYFVRLAYTDRSIMQRIVKIK